MMPTQYAENPKTGEWIKSEDGKSWAPIPAWEGKLATLIRKHDILVPSALETAGQVGGGLAGSALGGIPGGVAGGTAGFGLGRELSRKIQEWAGRQVGPESAKDVALKDVGGGLLNEALGGLLGKAGSFIRGTLTPEGKDTVSAFQRTGIPLHRWEVPGTGEKMIGKAVTKGIVPSRILQKAEDVRGAKLENAMDALRSQSFPSREEAGQKLLDTINASLQRQKGEFDALYGPLDEIGDHPPANTLKAAKDITSEFRKTPTISRDYASAQAAKDIQSLYSAKGGMKGQTLRELRGMRQRLRNLMKRATPDDKRYLSRMVDSLTKDMQGAAKSHGMEDAFNQAEKRYSVWNRMKETPVMKELSKYGVAEDPESGAISVTKDFSSLPSLPGKTTTSYRDLLQMMRYSPATGKMEPNVGRNEDALLRKIVMTHHVLPPGGTAGLTGREQNMRLMQMLRSPSQEQALKPKQLTDMRRVLSHLSSEKSGEMGGNPSGSGEKMMRMGEIASIPVLIANGDWKTLGAIMGSELAGGVYAKRGTNPQSVMEFIRKMDPANRSQVFQSALQRNRPFVTGTTSVIGNAATENPQ